MRKKATLVAILILAGAALFGNGLYVHADYTIPLNNDSGTESFVFGAGYTFWGVFQFSGATYTTMTFAPDKFLGIDQVRPVGLFSFGLGMNIPMGDFALVMDWQKLYQRGNETLNDYADTFKIGGEVALNEYLGIQVYSRRIYNYADQFVSEDPDGKSNLLGAGLVLHLF